MRTRSWPSLSVRFGAMALVIATGGAAWAEEDETPLINEQPAQKDPDVYRKSKIGRPAVDLINDLPANFPGIVQRKLPDYWLGIACIQAQPALLHQLKLEQAVVVGQVQPGSPAEKAGFKEHDVVVSVGDKALSEPEQVLQLLDEGKDKELSFNVIRVGEKITIAVTPEKRPEPKEPVRDNVIFRNGQPWDVFRDQVGRLGVPVRMHFFHPGTVLPSGMTSVPFPKDLQVHIHKHGNDPAKIMVEQGEKKWETTEDKLGVLPNEIRPHVEGLLGRASAQPFEIELDKSGPTATGTPTAPSPPSDFQQRLEQQMNDLSRQMEELKQQLKEQK